MKNVNTKILAIVLVILLAGCTNNTASTVAAGTLTFDAEVEEPTISAGEQDQISVTVTNMFTNDMENVSLTLEPTITGITYFVSGPTVLKANETKVWDIDVSTSAGLTAKPYNLYPIICFDYTQNHKTYFRVANGEPTEEADSSTSDNGPLDITVTGIQSFNANAADKLNVRVSFGYGNNIVGAQHIYTDESPLLLTSGEFSLDSVNNNLKLTTLAGGSSNYLNKDQSNSCPVQTGGANAGFGLCHFTSEASYDVLDTFNFDIVPVSTITGELESSFKVSVGYRYCIRAVGSTTSITVEASQ